MSTLSGAETARKRFLLWEMGFPDAKISCDSDVHAAGVDFYARGLRLSRALPGVWVGGRGIFLLRRGISLWKNIAILCRFLFQEGGVFCGVGAENVVKWAQAKGGE